MLHHVQAGAPGAALRQQLPAGQRAAAQACQGPPQVAPFVPTHPAPQLLLLLLLLFNHVFNHSDLPYQTGRMML